MDPLEGFWARAGRSSATAIGSPTSHSAPTAGGWLPPAIMGPSRSGTRRGSQVLAEANSSSRVRLGSQIGTAGPRGPVLQNGAQSRLLSPAVLSSDRNSRESVVRPRDGREDDARATCPHREPIPPARGSAAPAPGVLVRSTRRPGRGDRCGTGSSDRSDP
jgi:hypothetical protein